MPAEQAPRTVPVRVRIGLSAEQRRAFDGFAQAMRWPADDAAKIVLAYPAAIAEGEGLVRAEVREALGAARAELATLRYRAFMADETIRMLEMNLAGFTAAIAQFDRSLPLLVARRDALRARYERLAAEARAGGVDVPAEADDPGTAQERLLGFFRRHGRDAGEPGAGGGAATR